MGLNNSYPFTSTIRSSLWDLKNLNLIQPVRTKRSCQQQELIQCPIIFFSSQFTIDNGVAIPFMFIILDSKAKIPMIVLPTSMQQPFAMQGTVPEGRPYGRGLNQIRPKSRRDGLYIQVPFGVHVKFLSTGLDSVIFYSLNIHVMPTEKQIFSLVDLMGELIEDRMTSEHL